MKIDQYEIPLKLWQIEEILEKRVETQGHKIECLFMIWSAQATKPAVKFLDTQVRTKFGLLRFFIIPDLEPNKAFVLHTAKFPYPKRENHFDQDLRGFDRNGDLNEDVRRPN